ncbi:MAG: cupin domain-containing protein [Desulfobacterales bacterium]
MICYQSDAEYKEMLPGIQRKDLVHGRHTQLCEFRLAAGALLPNHHHPHEQTGGLIQGRIRLTIDGQAHEFGAGDAWCIPGDVGHSVEVLEDAVVWEVFSPPREDYLSGA